jgi:hypothetical protein
MLEKGSTEARVMASFRRRDGFCLGQFFPCAEPEIRKQNSAPLHVSAKDFGNLNTLEDQSEYCFNKIAL